MGTGTHWCVISIRHRSETPLFTEVGLEFIDYL